ncbi:MAG: ferritin family protein [Eisenbergiella sp.]
MYPGFAAVAREEGFEEIAGMFEKVAAIEKNHEEAFLRALIQLKASRQRLRNRNPHSLRPPGPATAVCSAERCGRNLWMCATCAKPSAPLNRFRKKRNYFLRIIISRKRREPDMPLSGSLLFLEGFASYPKVLLLFIKVHPVRHRFPTPPPVPPGCRFHIQKSA